MNYFCQHAGCNGPHGNMALRSHPSPKVKGSDRECQAATAQERQLRGASPRPRSGAAAERSYPIPKVRGPAPEELPHLQGAATAQVQEGREELLHFQGQEGQPWDDTPRPR